jgi:hypothetical protein
MLLLDTLQTLDTAFDGWGEGFDVPGWLANERVEFTLNHGEESRVLEEGEWKRWI